MKQERGFLEGLFCCTQVAFLSYTLLCLNGVKRT